MRKGMLILAIWLCLAGAASLFNLSFQGMNIVMGILALVAGILILIDKPWR